MDHNFLLVAYGVLFVIVFAAFGMQRTTLLISRESNIPAQQLTALLLPGWFPLIWLPRIVKWGLLVVIGVSWSWWVAFGVLAADLALSAVLPIPHKLYAASFRKRISRVRVAEPEAGEALEVILAESRLFETH